MTPASLAHRPAPFDRAAFLDRSLPLDLVRTAGPGNGEAGGEPMTFGTLARILSLAISLVAVGIVVAQVNLAATAAVLSRAVPLPLALALTALMAQLGVLAQRWRLLLPIGLDGRRVPYRAVTEALLVGNLANAVLPGRLGEVARAVAVSRRGSVDTAASFGVVALERVLDLAILAGVALVAAFVVRAPWFLSQPLAVVTIVSFFVIILLLTGIAARLMDRLSVWASSHVHGRGREALFWLTRLVDGLHAGERPSVVLFAIAATAISVLLDGVIFWAVGHSLGIELDWSHALLIGAAGILVTGIPSAPANIGTFELAVAWVGATVGVPTEAGLALAVIAHLIIVLPLSLTGAVVLLMSARAVGRTVDMDQRL